MATEGGKLMTDGHCPHHKTRSDCPAMHLLFDEWRRVKWKRRTRMRWLLRSTKLRNITIREPQQGQSAMGFENERRGHTQYVSHVLQKISWHDQCRSADFRCYSHINRVVRVRRCVDGALVECYWKDKTCPSAILSATNIRRLTWVRTWSPPPETWQNLRRHLQFVLLGPAWYHKQTITGLIISIFLLLSSELGH